MTLLLDDRSAWLAGVLLVCASLGTILGWAEWDNPFGEGRFEVQLQNLLMIGAAAAAVLMQRSAISDVLAIEASPLRRRWWILLGVVTASAVWAVAFFARITVEGGEVALLTVGVLPVCLAAWLGGAFALSYVAGLLVLVVLTPIDGWAGIHPLAFSEASGVLPWCCLAASVILLGAVLAWPQPWRGERRT